MVRHHPRRHFVSKTMTTRGRTRGGSIATTTTTTTTHRWDGVRDGVGDDAHSLENLERLFERVHTHGVFVKNRITTPQREREGEKNAKAVERAARVFVSRL